MTAETTNWADRLSEGDKVIMSSTRGGDLIASVVKVTAKYVDVQTALGRDPIRFNKRTHRRAGETDAWVHTSIHMATSEWLTKIRHENMSIRLANVKREEWQKLDLGQLITIYKMVHP